MHEVERIWLTASGGPFLNTPKSEFAVITVQQALNHPTWKMGKRITIDSATLMNKGFEVIEACRLFDVPPDRCKSSCIRNLRSIPWSNSWMAAYLLNSP